MAVGRRPNGRDIGAERMPASTSMNVAISRWISSCAPICRIFSPSVIFAGEPMLAHKASHEGKLAAEIIAGGGHKSQHSMRAPFPR